MSTGSYMKFGLPIALMVFGSLVLGLTVFAVTVLNDR